MTAKFKVRFDINKEIDENHDYWYSDNNHDDLIDQVIGDWNGTGDGDRGGDPMNQYLINDLKDEKGIDAPDLTLNMEYDEDVSDDSFIITLESSVDVPTDYVLDWLKGQFSDGFGEADYSKVDKYYKAGSSYISEENTILIKEHLTFDVKKYGFSDRTEIVVTKI